MAFVKSAMGSHTSAFLSRVSPVCPSLALVHSFPSLGRSRVHPWSSTHSAISFWAGSAAARWPCLCPSCGASLAPELVRLRHVAGFPELPRFCSAVGPAFLGASVLVKQDCVVYEATMPVPSAGPEAGTVSYTYGHAGISPFLSTRASSPTAFSVPLSRMPFLRFVTAGSFLIATAFLMSPVSPRMASGNFGNFLA